MPFASSIDFARLHSFTTIMKTVPLSFSNGFSPILKSVSFGQIQSGSVNSVVKKLKSLDPLASFAISSAYSSLQLIGSIQLYYIVLVPS